MAGHAFTIRGKTPRNPPFELIDLDTHPDGLLLRMCVCLGRTRDAINQLEDAIERTPAVTLDGRRMKEMAL
jgi:hypothetical protein